MTSFHEIKKKKKKSKALVIQYLQIIQKELLKQATHLALSWLFVVKMMIDLGLALAKSCKALKQKLVVKQKPLLGRLPKECSTFGQLVVSPFMNPPSSQSISRDNKGLENRPK